MNRKSFLKRSLLGAFGLAVAPTLAGKKAKEQSTYDKLMDQVGFNHLPNKENRTMKTVYHPAQTRGHANHGWLDTHHTFSFANYYNPERMNFGVLRVLNDDIVDGGYGFGTHPHDNMEIISIPLEGALEHKDSMGNTHVIQKGDVQAMSAGTGIRHSEYNRNKDVKTNFLQIWVFPNAKNVEPRYDQQAFAADNRNNKLQQVLSPNPEDEGVWIHQDAWFHLGKFDKGQKISYEARKQGNGIYLFVLEGSIKVGDQALAKKDGYGLWDTEGIEIEATEDADFLLMDVPMHL